MRFFQMRSKQHLEVVCIATQILFLQMHLSLAALAAHNGFRRCVDTWWLHQVQSHRTASEWLSRIHAATSRAIWRQQRTIVQLKKNGLLHVSTLWLFTGEDDGSPFLMLLCWKSAPPLHIITDTYTVTIATHSDSYVCVVWTQKSNLIIFK